MTRSRGSGVTLSEMTALLRPRVSKGEPLLVAAAVLKMTLIAAFTVLGLGVCSSPASAAGPYSIWSSTQGPAGGEGNLDPNPVEVGVRFRADTAGEITGIRFFKISGNNGTHVGHLWTNTGTLLGTANFTGETSTGWQTATFSSPVSILAGVTYVASFHTTSGYAATRGYFLTSSDNPPLHAPASASGALNGVYTYSASTVFPTQSTRQSNYWVDVVFSVPSSTEPATNPSPALTELRPSSAAAGGAGFVLTVRGGNFVSGSVVRWNGSDRATTFVSGSTLTASIPTGDISSSGSASVAVFNPAPGGGLSNALTFTIGSAPIDNPVPTLASLSPSSTAAGSPGFTLTVLGSSFVSGAVVRWNGSDRPTAFVSGSTLTASVLSSDVASAGTAMVTVFNPGPGGGTSVARSFVVSESSATPPPPSPAGALFVEQFSYPNGLITNANSASIVSGTWTVIAGSMFADSGTGWTGVPDNVAPNATSSNGTGSVYFRPLTRKADFGDVSLYFSLVHQGFVSVNPPQNWDGVHVILRRQAANIYYLLSVNRRDNTVVLRKQRGTTLTSFISAPFTVPIGATQQVQADIQTQSNGSVLLRVLINGALRASFTDAGTGGLPITGLGSVGLWGGNSNFRFDDFIVMPFGVAPSTGPAPNPVPTLASISPTSAAAGSPSFTMNVRGSGFVSSSAVRWNGLNRDTIFISSGQLSAQISASDIASAGAGTVTVFNPVPGGGTSNSATFTITSATGANCLTSAGTWQNRSFSSQTGSFEATFEATPGSGGMDGVSGFSNGPASDYTALASVVRFNTLGSIDARNGGAYDADISIPYSAGTVYRFRLAINVPAHTYSAYVTTGVASEQLLASNYSFRTEQNSVGALNNLGLYAATGNESVCNLVVSTATSDNPVPSIATLAPSSASAGGAPFTLQVTGSNFAPTSIIHWNGFSRQTAFINSATLTAAIPASDIAIPGGSSVTVSNPSPGGGLSNAASFTVGPTSAAGREWIAVSSMTFPHYAHTMTLLKDGTVLVTGGGYDPSPIADLYDPALYDPATGRWTRVGSMAMDRYNHLAVLLPDGKVLVGGGLNREESNFTAELYDPATKVFTPTGSMALPHGPPALLLPNGKVLVIGELYDPATGTWAPTGSPTVSGPMILLRNGKVLIAGGGSSELYDPASGTWTATGSMLFSRGGHSVTLLPDGRVLAAGGGPTQAEIYNPTNGLWAGTGAMLSVRYGHGAVVLPEGLVLIAGGSSDSAYTLSSSELYDPTTGTWEKADFTTAERGGATFVLIADGSVLAAGGRDGNGKYLASAELFVRCATPCPPQNPVPTNGYIGRSTTNIAGYVSLEQVAMAGDPGFTLTVHGGSFLPNSVVRWDGADRPTTFLSETLLEAQIFESDVAEPKDVRVTVFNPPPGGGVSQAKMFTVKGSFSPGVLLFQDGFDLPNGLISNEYAYNNAAATDAVRSPSWNVRNGSLFADSQEAWTGVPDDARPDATSSNGTGSNLFRLSTKRNDYGNVEVSMKFGERPDGAPSSYAFSKGLGLLARWKDAGNSYYFFMDREPGTYYGTVYMGKTVNGQGETIGFDRYVPAGTEAVATVYNMADGRVELTFTIGGYTMQVFDDEPGQLLEPGAVGVLGNKSNFVFDDFTIKAPNGFAPGPTLASISPNSGTAGDSGFTLTASGQRFSASTVVLWNGSPRPTTFVSASTVTAAISSADMASSGTVQVGVTGSNTFPFTIAMRAVAFSDDFNQPDGLLTNQNSASPRSAKWLVTNGSLFASGAQGWTGVPDTVIPNATSSNGTGSALFRALTVPSNIGSEVTARVTVQGFVSARPIGNWDGAHIYLRYLDAGNYYQLSVYRRDGRAAIKKRRNGTESTFTTPLYGAAPIGTPQSVRAVATTNPNGSVTIQLYVNGSLAASAVDTSNPITALGKVGMAGENTNFRFDDFTVPSPGDGGMGVASLAAGSPAVLSFAPASRLVQSEYGGRVERIDATGVNVPENALETDLDITVDRANEESEADAKRRKRLEKRIQPASDEIEYFPSNTYFKEPVTVVLAYNPAKVAAAGINEDDLKVYSWNSTLGDWEVLPSVVDKEAMTVSAMTKHFSVYQAMGPGDGIGVAAADPTFGVKAGYGFPNPIRGVNAVTIRIQPGIADGIEVNIYDLSGRKVHSSSDFRDRGAFDDGNGLGQQFTYDHVWNVSGVGSGVYTYVITARKAGQSDIRKSGKLGVVK